MTLLTQQLTFGASAHIAGQQIVEVGQIQQWTRSNFWQMFQVCRLVTVIVLHAVGWQLNKKLISLALAAQRTCYVTDA